LHSDLPFALTSKRLKEVSYSEEALNAIFIGAEGSFLHETAFSVETLLKS